MASSQREDEPGSRAGEAPTRAELELALRAAHLSIAELREDLHALAAQVVALTELAAPALTELAAPATTPANPAAAPAPAAPPDAPADFEERVTARTAVLRRELAIADERSRDRVMLGVPGDKYAIVPEPGGDGGPPCLELLPICGARCCSFEVALTTQDLDEGQLRWDYATPYLLSKRAEDGLCVYNHGGCDVYATRPAPCRRYDCRSDTRIWIDYERRLLTPKLVQPQPTRQALEDDARARQQAMFVEASRLRRRR